MQPPGTRAVVDRAQRGLGVLDVVQHEQRDGQVEGRAWRVASRRGSRRRWPLASTMPSASILVRATSIMPSDGSVRTTEPRSASRSRPSRPVPAPMSMARIPGVRGTCSRMAVGQVVGSFAPFRGVPFGRLVVEYAHGSPSWHPSRMRLITSENVAGFVQGWRPPRRGRLDAGALGTRVPAPQPRPLRGRGVAGGRGSRGREPRGHHRRGHRQARHHRHRRG